MSLCFQVTAVLSLHKFDVVLDGRRPLQIFCQKSSLGGNNFRLDLPAPMFGTLGYGMGAGKCLG